MNPCGKVMDFLRSCYNTQCRFSRGDPTQSTIEWFFANDGAQLFTGLNAFTSSIWTNNLGWDGTIGEVQGSPRIYSKGVAPIPSQGLTICGNTADFENGPPRLTTPRPVNAITGQYVCCGQSCYPIFHPASTAVFHLTGGPFTNQLLGHGAPGVFFVNNGHQAFQLTVDTHPCALFGTAQKGVAFRVFDFDHGHNTLNMVFQYMPSTTTGFIEFQSAPSAWWNGLQLKLVET